MRNILLSLVLGASGITLAAAGASAFEGDRSGAPIVQVQYGGGGYGRRDDDGPRYRRDRDEHRCHWERRQVRVWDRDGDRYVMRWTRVRSCD